MPASAIRGDGCGANMNFDIPSGLTQLLQDFTVAVLRSRPADLQQFAADYFGQAYERRVVMGISTGSSKEWDLYDVPVITTTLSHQETDEEETADFFPPPPPCGRRKSVAAEQYDPEADQDDGIRITHPKSEEQYEWLNSAVKHILLFRSLEEKQLQDVINAMFAKEVSTGEHVIKEGDDGDNFYVIDTGVYDILVNAKKVGAYDNQGSFGELALMYNMPRAATIVAKCDGRLWAVDRNTFRRIVLKNAFNKRKMYEALIESVPMLKSLDMYERMNVADALLTKSFSDGDMIIEQGDTADCMYFVEDGEVRIAMKQAPSELEKDVTKCRKGEYFGELALVTHKPRAASAYAVGIVRLAVLDVAAFERVLGPCMDIMQRNIDAYEEQLEQVFGSRITIADT